MFVYLLKPLKQFMSTKNERQLPKLAELHHDIDVAFKNDQLNLLLNQPPHESWTKKAHASMGGGAYLPIGRVEDLLTRIFQEWRVEVKDVQQIFNAVCVTVRLHYKNPLTGEWSYHDGIGAKSVQTDAGKNASDLGAIKDAAVMMSAPSAKSFAIKDAAEHLGKLFGRDLSRKDIIAFSGAYNKPEGGEFVPDVPAPEDVPTIQIAAPKPKEAPAENPLTNPAKMHAVSAPAHAEDFDL